MKTFLVFKIYFESTYKVLRLHQYLLSEISWEWSNSPLNFFWNLHGRAFSFYILSNGANVKASILVVVLKCIVVGYSNGNESFIGRLFSNYGSLNMLFHFFWYLIYSVFHKTFIEKFLKKLSFFISNLKNPFQDVAYYRKLRCVTSWYQNYGPLNVKSWKFCPFLRLFFQK